MRPWIGTLFFVLGWAGAFTLAALVVSSPRTRTWCACMAVGGSAGAIGGALISYYFLTGA